MMDIPELRTHTSTIKRGHYGLLDVHTKLGIFVQLVNHAIRTDIFREKLDEIIEQRHVLGATRRGEALEEARKKREEKEQLKAKPDANCMVDLKNVENVSSNGYHITQQGEKVKTKDGEVNTSQEDHASGKRFGFYDILIKVICFDFHSYLRLMLICNYLFITDSESKDLDSALKTAKKDNVDVKIPIENGKDSSRKAALKQLKDDKKDTAEGLNKEQRVQFSPDFTSLFVCIHLLLTLQCLCHRKNFTSGKWRNALCGPALWAETEIIIGTGGFDVMEEYLSRIPI